MLKEALALNVKLANMRFGHNPAHVHIGGQPRRRFFGENEDHEDRERYNTYKNIEFIIGYANCYPFHQIIDYDTILKKGFTGIKEDALAHAEKFEREGDEEAADVCRAVGAVCDSTCAISDLFADVVADTAKDAEPEHAKKLMKLSAMMKQVPKHPASSFREAMQAYFFAWTLQTDGFGRMDLILWEYYKNDIDKGAITQAEAREVLVDFFRQVNEQTGAPKGEVTYVNRSITLGGLDQQGNDITNDLTYLFLDVMAELAFATSPAVYMRVSRKTPDALLRRALDIIASGIGYPAFFNDEVFIEGLHDVGVSIEDAHDYAPTGCGEMTVPGRNLPNCALSQFHALMVVLVTMNNGRNPDTGEQVGPKTGEFEDFESFDEFYAAFKTQFAYFLEKATDRANVIMEDIHYKGYLDFYSTAVTRDCITKGTKFNGGGERYTFGEICLHGMPNVIDSIAMLKKYVFGNSADRMTPTRFKEMLSAEFEGHEAFKARLLNDTERWGNDNAEADKLAKDLFHFAFSEITKRKNFFGGPFVPMAISFISNQGYGIVTPATPDGRKKGEPLAAVNSSVHGCDRSGITALFNSMAKIDWRLAPGSIQCGISLHPSMLRTSADRDKFVSLFKTQIAAKGFSQLLANVLDNDVLIEAKKNPEKYRNINVRVSGFNAQFVDLPENVQDEIISRTKHRN